MSGALSTILTFVGGGVFVFVATEVANWIRSQHARRQLQQNVRTLLHVEIEQNLAMLQELFNKVMLNYDGIPYPEEVELQRRTRFAFALPPQWGRLMWESQAVHLSEVFTQEFIQRIYQVYTHLDNLTAYQVALRSNVPPHLASDYEDLLRLNREARAQGKQPAMIESWSDYPKLKQFLVDSDALWNQSYGLMNGLLNSGNPVSIDMSEHWIISMRTQMARLKMRVRSPIAPSEDVKAA